MKEVIMFNKITKEEKEEEFKIVKEKVNENCSVYTEQRD